MRYTVILACAGQATRFGNNNKLLFCFENGVSVVEKTLEVFLTDQKCDQIIIGVNSIIKEYLETKFPQNPRLEFVMGGDTRVETVANCVLNTLIRNDITLVHDGARCNISLEFINAILDEFCMSQAQVLIPVLPVSDTIKRIDGQKKLTTINRDKGLVTVQTPELFQTKILKEAYLEYRDTNNLLPILDDAQLVELFLKNVEIKTCKGDPNNIKITYFSDIKKIKV